MPELKAMSGGGYQPAESRHRRLLHSLLMTAADLSDQTKRWLSSKKAAVSPPSPLSCVPDTGFGAGRAARARRRRWAGRYTAGRRAYRARWPGYRARAAIDRRVTRWAELSREPAVAITWPIT